MCSQTIQNILFNFVIINNICKKLIKGVAIRYYIVYNIFVYDWYQLLIRVNNFKRRRGSYGKETET